MVENMYKIWTINDLMKRYGINRASMTEYAKSKIDIINKDGVHAKKSGKEWQFNAEAVRILDELRGYGMVVENYDTPEKAKIAELEKELEEARKFMAAAQAENSRQKDKIIKLLEDKDLLQEGKNKSVELLAAAESERKIAEAKLEAKDEKLAELQAVNCQKDVKIEAQTEEIARLKADLEAEKLARQDAEAKAEAEAKKSLWDWFLGR